MKKQSPESMSPVTPLNILPSPTDSSGRRQVVSLGRDATVPSFTQLDGAATASPPLEPPSSQPPPGDSHCQSVEYHADYGDPPPSDAPPLHLQPVTVAEDPLSGDSHEDWTTKPCMCTTAQNSACLGDQG